MADAEEAVETASVVEEPQDYWEKEQVANQIAQFGGRDPHGSDIPMLVAVRVRPLWEKVCARALGRREPEKRSSVAAGTKFPAGGIRASLLDLSAVSPSS